MSGHFMRSGLVLMAAVVLLSGGCDWFQKRTPLEIGQAVKPYNGKLQQHGPDGKLLQETTWDNGRLTACWEWVQESHWVDGKQMTSPPVWTQTVSGGTGKRTVYDSDGKPLGTEDYQNGLYVGMKRL